MEGSNEYLDGKQNDFLHKLIAVLLDIRHIFERSFYSMNNCSFKNKEVLMFANNVECKAKLSKATLREFAQYSNFDLYPYLMRSSIFQNLVFESTINVCVFIGMMFPLTVTTPEELFELFHAVIFTF